MARSFVHYLDFTRCLVFLQIDSLGPPLSSPRVRMRSLNCHRKCLTFKCFSLILWSENWNYFLVLCFMLRVPSFGCDSMIILFCCFGFFFLTDPIVSPANFILIPWLLPCTSMVALDAFKNGRQKQVIQRAENSLAMEVSIFAISVLLPLSLACREYHWRCSETLVMAQWRIGETWALNYEPIPNDIVSNHFHPHRNMKVEQWQIGGPAWAAWKNSA